jgi:hypothetical protein
MSVDIDRSDPRYRKAVRKRENYLALLNSAALITASEDDDEVVLIFAEAVREKWDELWALKHPRKR